MVYATGASTAATSSNLTWDNTNGRLGIGTTTPGSALQVYSTATGSDIGRFWSATGTSSAALSLNNTNTAGWDIYAQGGAPSYFQGPVGIGSTAPVTALDVSGQIRSSNGGSTLVNSTLTIDWNKGNVQTTTASCGAATFTNMQDGGSYTLIVTGATSGTCTFSQSGLTWKFVPGNGATTAATTTVYTFLRAGTVVYVSWISGF